MLKFCYLVIVISSRDNNVKEFFVSWVLFVVVLVFLLIVLVNLYYCLDVEVNVLLEVFSLGGQLVQFCI